MKKRNVLIHTAVASALLAMGFSAQAGSLTVTKRTVANESFGSAYTSTTPVYVPNVQYVFNSPGGIVMNPGGQVTVKFVLAGGTWTSSAALGALNAGVASLPGGVTAGTPAINTAGDTVSVILTNSSTTANATIGIGATVTLTSIGGAARFQAVGVVQGTPVTVSGSAVNTAANVVLETATAPSTVVDYAQAVTLSFTASTETKKIDLTVAGAPGTALTSGVAGANLVQLGKVKATNNATVTPNDLDVVAASLAETPIVAGSPAFSAAYTLTVAPASGAFTAKQTIGLFTGSTCAGALAGTYSVAPTSGATTATTASILLTGTGSVANSATDLTGGVYVCSDYTAAAPNVIASFTPSISGTYTRASTAYTGDTLATATGYALTTNGQMVDVRSYIPAVTVGYTSYVRVINSGSVSAVVTGQWLYEDGTTSTAAALSATPLPAGGAKTYRSDAIEAAIGAPTATIGGNRPRLRLTAPTSGLQAQSFFLNPNNSFSTMHGAD